MRVNICDLCLVDGEGKISKAGWTLRIRRGFESIKLSICTEHKGRKMLYENAAEIGVAAQSRFNGMLG